MPTPESPRPLRPAAFLDRDGTIIEEVNYLTRPEDLRLEPGALDALRRLREAGYLLIVVTNQSAVARGMITERELASLHGLLERKLAQGGVRLDGIYYCPHHPDSDLAEYAASCDCRKPEPGMLLRAAADLGVDLGRSVMFGDSERDVEAGRRAGCRTALLHHGSPPAGTEADLSAVGLADAVARLLGE